MKEEESAQEAGVKSEEGLSLAESQSHPISQEIERTDLVQEIDQLKEKEIRKNQAGGIVTVVMRENQSVENEYLTLTVLRGDQTVLAPIKKTEMTVPEEEDVLSLKVIQRSKAAVEGLVIAAVTVKRELDQAVHHQVVQAPVAAVPPTAGAVITMTAILHEVATVIAAHNDQCIATLIKFLQRMKAIIVMSF